MRWISNSLALLLFLVTGPVASAQTSEDKADANARPLSSLQQQIQRDYERFEKSLYDVAEQSRGKDPERAELLYRARSQSQEQRILSDMELIAELLATQKDGSPARLGPAADQQIELLARMETVLKLLQSLDERSRIDAEIKRIEELLKDTTRLIARQKDVRADTQRSDNSEKLKGDQEKVAKEAEKLSEKIDKQDKENAERNGKKSEGKDSEGKESENQDGKESKESGENSDGKESKEQNGDPKDGESQDGKPKDGESKDGMPKDGKPSESQDAQEGKPSDSEMKDGEPMEGKGEPMDGQSKESEGEKSEGKPQQGQQSDGKQPQGNPQPGQQGEQSQGQQDQQQQQEQDEQTPGREDLEKAREQMQKAIEDLEKQNQEKAVDDQDAAVAQLEKLKAELEEILRQLREEEKETYLTLLEARFQMMLKRQERINKDTKRLFAIADEDRLQQNYNSQTDGVRKEQSENVFEAEKTLNLLKEEGSSVAFPEAIEQMMQNMLVAESRLSKYDTGKTTQLVEELILETLEEMIAALQKELEKMEQKKQQQQQQQQGQPQEPGLVDQIAELKMIRSLQNQINRLTTQLSEELGENAPTDADQIKLIDDLANRQQRIKDATYDLSIGRNK